MSGRVIFNQESPALRKGTLRGTDDRQCSAGAQCIELWSRIVATIVACCVWGLHLPHRNRLVVVKTGDCRLFIDREGRCPVRLDDPEPQVHRSEIAIGLGKVLQRGRHSSGKSAAGRGGPIEVKERNVSPTRSKSAATAPDLQYATAPRNYHDKGRLGRNPRCHLT